MKILLSALLGLMVLIASPSFAKGMNKCIDGDKVIYTVKNCTSKDNRAAMDKGTFTELAINGGGGEGKFLSHFVEYPSPRKKLDHNSSK